MTLRSPKLAATVTLTLLTLLASAPTAGAAESISSGPWAGSALSAGASSVTVPSYKLAGTFRRSSIDRQVAVTVAASPAGSGACKVNPTSLPPASTPRGFSVTLAVPCNGVYQLTATAVTTDNNAFFPQESATLDRTVTVAAPAPVVTGVSADSTDRTVTVRWDDMRDAAPDLTGYVLERKVGSGSYKVIKTLSESADVFTDKDLPDAGGTATYRVFSTRPGPDGELVSDASATSSAEFAPVPTTTTTGAAGDGGSGGSGEGSTGGGDGTTGDTSSPGSGGGTTAKSPSKTKPGVSAPRVFSGTFLPPLLRPVDQTIRTTTTVVDDGYEEALPFGDREVGAEDPVLPNDAMASILSDGESGRGLVIPVGTALVLAMWAVHLRVLARAARPID